MFALNGEQILRKSITDLEENSNSLSIEIGCELEFFLFGDYDEKFIAKLKENLIDHFDIIYDLKAEQGTQQYEINIVHSKNLYHLAQTIANVRDFIVTYCEKAGLTASFNAKPIKDDCSSAMQFNISLHEGQTNLFADLHNEHYKNLIATLLKKSPEILFLSAQNKEEFQRFNKDKNISLFKTKKYVAPTNYSYGFDNRSCLIRCLKNRLEYRLPSASCDVFLMLSAIILIIKESLNKKITLQDKAIYGNSFDDIYKIKPLEDYDQAKENFELGTLLSDVN